MTVLLKVNKLSPAHLLIPFTLVLLSILLFSCGDEASLSNTVTSTPADGVGKSYFYPRDLNSVPVEGPGGPGDLRGIVLDEDLMPAANLTVTLSQTLTEDGEKSSLSPAESIATSDDRGRFHFIGIPSADYVLKAFDNHRFASENISLRSTDLSLDPEFLYLEGPLILAPSGDIAGHVRDAAGEPLVGAEVTVLPIRADGSFGDSAKAITRTGAEGAFALPNVPKGVTGRCRLFVRAGNSAPVLTEVLPIGSPDVSITLTQGGRILGILVALENGAPLAGQRVYIQGERSLEFYEITSDAEGVFSKNHLRPATYQIWCEGADWSHADLRPVTVQVAEGAETPVKVTAVRASSASGRVYDRATGIGIGNTKVYAAHLGPLKSDTIVRQRITTTANDGTFKFESLIPGTYRVFAHDAPGYRVPNTTSLNDKVRWDVILRAGATFDGVGLALEQVSPRAEKAGRVVNGRVVDTKGAPVPNALIHHHIGYGRGYGRGWRLATVKSGSDGHFSVTHVESTFDRVGAYKGVLSSEHLNLASLADGEEITLTLSRELADIVGKVYHGPNRKPYPWAHVILKGLTNDVTALANTTPSGAFRFSGLPPGTYRIHATRAFKQGRPPAGKEISASIEISLAPGEERRAVEFILQGYFPWEHVMPPEGRLTISGRITSWDGSPLYGISVRARSESGWWRHAKTDIDGRYTITRLPKGVYNVHAMYSVNRKGVRAGSDNVDFVGHRRIAGSVVDAESGEPISNYMVGYDEGIRRTQIADHIRMISWVHVKDPSGRFTLYGAPRDGPVLVAARADEYVYNSIISTAFPVDRPTEDVLIVLHKEE